MGKWNAHVVHVGPVRKNEQRTPFRQFFIIWTENFEIKRSQSVSQASTHVCFPLLLLHRENVGGTHPPIFYRPFGTCSRNFGRTPSSCPGRARSADTTRAGASLTTIQVTFSLFLIILPSKWLRNALVLYYGYSALSGYHLDFEMLTQRAHLGFEILMQRTYVTLPSKWLCSALVLRYGHCALNGYHLDFEMLTQRIFLLSIS